MVYFTFQFDSMKRVALLSFIFFLLLSTEVFSQRIMGGLSIGMNLTQVDGDEYYGFKKFGLNVGPMAIVPLDKNKRWTISLELLYSQKGSNYNGRTDTTSYKLRLDYVDIPVLFHFTDKRVISGGVGFAYGQLINVKEWKKGTVTDSITLQGPYNMGDLSVVADLQIRLWSKLWVDVRYQYSMLMIRKDVPFSDPTNPKNTWTRNQYNNVVSLRLTWVFNQEIPVKSKKRSGSQE